MSKKEDRFSLETCPKCNVLSEMLEFEVRELVEDPRLWYKIIKKYRCLNCMELLDRELH